MNTAALIRPPATPDRTASLSDAGRNESTSASEHSEPGGIVAEIVPLLGAVAGYGPPVLSLAGPWLFLALILSGPVALLVTLVAAMLVAAMLLVAATAAILAIAAAPCLLIRRVRRHRARRAFGDDDAAQLVPVGSLRVVS